MVFIVPPSTYLKIRQIPGGPLRHTAAGVFKMLQYINFMSEQILNKHVYILAEVHVVKRQG